MGQTWGPDRESFYSFMADETKIWGFRFEVYKLPGHVPPHALPHHPEFLDILDSPAAESVALEIQRRT